MLLLKNEKGITLAELERERTTIGRDPSNDLVLEDPSVSGFHAVVLNDRGAVSLVDLGSTNGTAMNGKRLRERTALKPWCSLQLGGVNLVVADTESREPTRVQPVVPAAGPEGRPDATVQRTQIRPAAQAATRVVRPPQPAGDIRFESLQSDAAGTRVSPSQPPIPPKTRVSPSQQSNPPATGVIGAQSPSPQPTVVQSRSQAPPTDDPYALFGGYPRGLGWLLFSFRGRITRSLFWKCFGVGLLAGIIFQLTSAFILWSVGSLALYLISLFVLALLTFWCWMAIFAKRIHDSGRGALPWCVYWAVLNVFSWIITLSQIDRDPRATALGSLFLLAAVPALYAIYLSFVKRGDDRDNQFGDRNPRRGIVFPS